MNVGLPQDGGETDSTLRGHKQNLACTRTQGIGAVTPQETEPDTPASVGRSPVKVWSAVAHRGDGSTSSSSPRRCPLAKVFLKVTINPTIAPVDSRAGLSQPNN